MRYALRAAFGVLLALAVWQGIASVIASPLLVPPPAMIWRSAWALLRSGELGEHIGASLGRLVIALSVGVPVGALLGCSLGRWSLLDAAINPFVRMFNSIPAIALVPFSLLWFGVTEMSRYALLFYTISLTVLLSTRQGVRNVPELRLKAGAALGVAGASAFLRIILPSCIPAIIVGVRTAIGLGVMVIVAAEMLGADSGLGYLIMQARSHFNVGDMMVGVISLGLLSVFLDRIFHVTIETLAPRWSVKRRIR